MKAGVLQEKILVASMSLAVVVAVATSTGLIVGIVGQALVSFILVLLYNTSFMQSLGILWEVLKKEVKLCVLGVFFLLCIFSDYLRFLAGGIVVLRCLILLGIADKLKRKQLIVHQPSNLHSTSPEVLMSPPKTAAKSHLKPRVNFRAPNVFTPLAEKFSSWMTPGKREKESPVPFFTAKMSPSRTTRTPKPSVSLSQHHEHVEESPPYLQQHFSTKSESPLVDSNPTVNHFVGTSSSFTAHDDKENVSNANIDEPDQSRVTGTKHSAENALTPYHPRKRAKNFLGTNFGAMEEDSLQAVLESRSQVDVKPSLGRPMLKRKTVSRKMVVAMLQCVVFMQSRFSLFFSRSNGMKKSVRSR